MAAPEVPSEIDVQDAASTIASMVLSTPLIRSEPLSVLTGGDVYLKLENLQRTGSFKVRGAAARIMKLTTLERQVGVVACSSGNHGRAVAHVARRLGISATICVPAWVDELKLRDIEAEGASVDKAAADYDAAERRAVQLAHEFGYTLIHPFDDRHILAGQGTLALEVLSDLPDADVIVAPLSGGGLVGGIAAAVRQSGALCEILAVSARNARVMVASLEAGRPVELVEEKTVASALSGGIGLQNRFTFRIVRDLVDRHTVVTEEQIVDAIRLLAREHRLIVEGGGATGVAGVLAEPERFRGRRTAVIVSGGNIALPAWIQMVVAA